MSIVGNSEEVETIFGYWPEFCDGKIQRFQFERLGSIDLRVSYIDADQDKRAVVDIRFFEVFDIELYELRGENVLDRLNFQESGEFLAVELEACSGLHGTFSCRKAEVLSVAT